MRVVGIDPSSREGDIGIAVIEDGKLVACSAVDYNGCLDIAWDSRNDMVFIETFRTKKVWHGKGRQMDYAAREAMSVNVGIGIGAMIAFAGFIGCRAKVQKVYPSDTGLSRKSLFDLTGYDTSINGHARDAFVIAYNGYRMLKDQEAAAAANEVECR